MSIFKTASLNTFYQLFGKGISLILGLYITSLISHTLPVQDYGRYVLVVGLILQIAAISEWGTGFIAVRAASQNVYPRAQIFTNLLISRLALSALGTLLLLIFSAFQIFDIPSSALILASAVIIPLGVKNVITSFFHSLTNFRITSILEVIANLIYALLLFLYSRNQFSLDYPILTLGISTLITTLVGLFLVYRQKGLQRHFQPQIIKYLFLNSIPVGGQLLIFNLYNRLDIYLLQIFHSDIAVARYGLAYKLYENSILLAAYFMNSMFPVISSAHHNLRPLFLRSLKLLTLAGVSVTVAIFFLAPFVVRIINPDYTDSITPLRILSLGLTATYLNHLTGYTLTAINKQHLFMGIAAIALGVNLLLNIILIPLYSYNAAAITTIITEVLICTLSLLVLRKLLTQKSQN